MRVVVVVRERERRNASFNGIKQGFCFSLFFADDGDILITACQECGGLVRADRFACALLGFFMTTGALGRVFQK